MLALCDHCNGGAHERCDSRPLCLCPVCSGAVSAEGFTFHEDSHTYWEAGERLPSVTEIIDAGEIGEDFTVIPQGVLERKREIGKAVHLASRFFDEDDLDDATIDPAIVGYIAGYRRFRAESGFQPVGWEQPLANLRHGYAGTPDRWGMLNYYRTVIDLKTVYTLNVRTVALQIAGGYHELLHEAVGFRPQRHYALHLRPDGTYKLVPAEHRLAWAVFHAALVHTRGEATRESEALLSAWREGLL